jgi:FkbM family methyltransferase
MNLISKIRSVTSNPVMLSAYARWIGAKLFSGKPPRLPLPGGARLGEWLSFSEYWSFQNTMPEAERLFVDRCLAGKARGGGTAFDVGANVGAFTCQIASLGPHAVHAFEPVPETFCRLKKNVKANGLHDRCRLNCLAVGRGVDLVTFHIQEASPATNHMAMPGGKPGREGTSTQVVAAIDLDGYCKSQGVKSIDFLKVDVEGMEPHVLQGARALLKERKIAAILIEICPGNLRAVGLSPADLYREFGAARYSPHALKDDGSPGAKLSLAEIEAICLANIVLLPDG